MLLSNKRIALFPGSFDPFTMGHKDIVRRALKLFDKVVVAIGVNSDKQYMFTVEERVAKTVSMLCDVPNIEVCHYDDMTVDCCHRMGATAIVRGIRNDSDLAYEKKVAAVNNQLDSNIETVFLLAAPDMEGISSTLERERLLHGYNRDK